MNSNMIRRVERIDGSGRVEQVTFDVDVYTGASDLGIMVDGKLVFETSSLSNDYAYSRCSEMYVYFCNQVNSGSI